MSTSDVVTASPDAWARLALAVSDRRNRELRLAQSDLVGPDLSLSSIGKLESGRAARYRGSTIRALEDALGWEPGSVQRVLDGGQPRLRVVRQAAAPEFDRASTTTDGGFDVHYVHRPNWTPERQIEFEEIVRRTADLIFGSDPNAPAPDAAPGSGSEPGTDTRPNR